MNRIDMHCHVGVIGDINPSYGGMSREYAASLLFKVFSVYARIKTPTPTDYDFEAAAISLINSSTQLNNVVCLALDPPYNQATGLREQEKAHVWVDNSFVIRINKITNGKALIGASVHPYDKDFKRRVTEVVNEGAALMKWLPSSQQIDLASPQVRDALEFLATAKNGKPLPVLIHIGPEHAIWTSDVRTTSFDYLTWGVLDRIFNFFRFSKKFHVPNEKQIESNLKNAVQKGGILILAHCGLPYYAVKLWERIGEHSEFRQVKKLMEWTKQHQKSLVSNNGAALPGIYADVSAFCTPSRQLYFKDVANLPPDLLVYGSDFPTPVFEINADHKENLEDMRAVFEGKIERIIIPEENLLDAHLTILESYFPGHPMFTTFSKML